jgi:hypothetical protein
MWEVASVYQTWWSCVQGTEGPEACQEGHLAGELYLDELDKLASFVPKSRRK